jgi:hypothetical protein
MPPPCDIGATKLAPFFLKKFDMSHELLEKKAPALGFSKIIEVLKPLKVM